MNDLERRGRELETLHTIGTAIAETLEPEEAMRRALDLLVEDGWFRCAEAFLAEAPADGEGRLRTVAVGLCPFENVRECQLKPSVDREAAEALASHEIRSTGGWRFVPVGTDAVLALADADGASLDFLGGVSDLLASALSRGRLHQRLAVKEGQRAKLLRSLLRAQEEERGRISRDLHDQIGQALTALLLGIERNIESADADDLRRLKEITSITLNDVRRIALDLRPSVLDELGLEAALRRFARELHERYELDVSLLVKLPRRLSRQEETVLYRVAQEALTNVVRHAGSPDASVVVTAPHNTALLVVEDSGKGFDPDALPSFDRIGLVGMAERVELLGGSLRIESTIGEGTTVYARIPVRGR